MSDPKLDNRKWHKEPNLIGDLKVGRKQRMRVLITGSREWRNYDAIYGQLAALPKGTVIVHGAATGADHMAHSAALALGLKVEIHFPDYDRYPPSEAPKHRNAEMVALGAALCLVFPTESSRGTWHCKRLADEAGIETIVVEGDTE